MDDDAASMVSTQSSEKTIMPQGEGSDSTINNLCQPSKRQKHDGNSGSPPPRFKGVVLQQNGHWGAQIYANHQRIWLGTFKSENDAAMAYDSAAMKLRNGDAHRNFPLSSISREELKFQDLFTTEEILNMIKDGSYNSKFMEFVMNQSRGREDRVEIDLGKRGCTDTGLSYHLMFQKELTPSDVGKLNRLVIPKKYAVKCFPQVSENSGDGEGDGKEIDDVQLPFVDRQMKEWNFRYCYWKSSQSYVFTRGWNRFVKEKKLKAKDVVTFYMCEKRDAFKIQKKFCVIDVEHDLAENSNSLASGFDTNDEKEVDLELSLGLSSNWSSSLGSDEGKSSDDDGKQLEEEGEGEEEEEEEENLAMNLETPPAQDNKCLKLFGVQIILTEINN